ncbi:MAG: ornithine cyclodeaminase family protein [Bacillota bacterium]
MLALNAVDLRSAISMKEAIDTVEEAYAAFSAGRTLAPLRTPMELPQGVTLTMPSFSASHDTAGVKVVSVFPDNPGVDLPTILGVMLLIDGSTGSPLAILDGASLTALRTGASGGVAAKYLARSHSRVAAVIGAGVQGRSQLEALFQVRNLSEVRVFDIDRDRAERFVDEMKDDGEVEFAVCDNSAEAMSGADVIVCATTSTNPVFEYAEVSRGAHITGIGSYRPDMAEIGADTIRGADRVVVDSREACWEEAGDFIQPFSRGDIPRAIIGAELGEIVAGKVPGRSHEDELTLFKAVGLAPLDVAVARKAYDRARDLGIGTPIDMA